MEKTINQQLDGLFRDWDKALRTYVGYEPDNFTRDGLIYKYKPKWGFEKEYPTLAGTDTDLLVNGLWNKSSIKIVFLLKDKPDESGGDVRQWLLYEHNNGKCSRELQGGKVGRIGFLPTIARVIYGIYKSTPDNLITFGEVSGIGMGDVRDMWNSLDGYPYALVETKKMAGIPYVRPQQIKEALLRDSEFLKKELSYLNPNVFVCTHPSIYKFVQDFLAEKYKDVQDNQFVKIPNESKPSGFEESILLHRPSKSVILLGYHPSYYRLSRKERYMSYMSHYHAFVQSSYYNEFFQQN
ncbi:MAG: hypothetical protein II970_05335 [Paludibacteraceae bacterium]|nr:hypothetical protein [Paludibacteraceae bacterium]